MRGYLGLLTAVAVVLCTTRGAEAKPEFQKEFFKKYVDGHKDPEFQKLAKQKAKCNVCHQGRKNKHNVNPYGAQLEKLLDPKKDAKNVDKIIAALTKVGAMHSDAKDDKSPTFDELIASGKLPGGSLEESLKEPKKGEGEAK